MGGGAPLDLLELETRLLEAGPPELEVVALVGDLGFGGEASHGERLGVFVRALGETHRRARCLDVLLGYGDVLRLDAPPGRLEAHLRKIERCGLPLDVDLVLGPLDLQAPLVLFELLADRGEFVLRLLQAVF